MIICSTEDIWECLETFVTVMTEEVTGIWYIEARPSYNAQETSLQQRIIQPTFYNAETEKQCSKG